MPIYEFQCRRCEKPFESLCSMGETGERLSCPACGAKRPRKMLSTFAAHGGAVGNDATADPCACGKPRPFS